MSQSNGSGVLVEIFMYFSVILWYSLEQSRIHKSSEVSYKHTIRYIVEYSGQKHKIIQCKNVHGISNMLQNTVI